MACGFGLLRLRWNRSAAVFIGLSMAFSMAVLPWVSLTQLMVSNRALRTWARPRLGRLHWSWATFSLGFAAVVSLRVGLRERTEQKKDYWEPPQQNVDPERPIREVLTGKGLGEKTFLGMCNGPRSVTLGDVERQGHMQVVGPTRCGKSQLLFAITGQDMRRGMPVFFMEAKGDRSDFDQFLKLASLAGRANAVRYFNPQDPRSMTFNPIRMVPGQDPIAIANQIARALGLGANEN